jgi:hypothetical protein
LVRLRRTSELSRLPFETASRRDPSTPTAIMAPKSENGNTMAAQPDEVTTTSSIAHKDSSSELDDFTSSTAQKDSSSESGDVTSSTAQKDSSSDNSSVDSVESGEAVVPSSFSVNTTNVPTTTVTVYTRTSVAARTANNEDVKRLIIPNVNLNYTTIDAALSDGLMGRVPMIIHNDDAASIKNDPDAQIAWVTELITAFTRDYLTTPEDSSRNSPAQKEWFSRWQRQPHATLVSLINAKDPDHLEKSCWHLLSAVLKAHELGVVDAGNNLHASKLKCSKRLACIVGILEKYALVRLDVLKAWHVDEIAMNPEAFIKRKLVNCWNNANRAERAKVAGTKRGPGEGVEEQTEEGEGQTPAMGKGKKARKSHSDTTTDADATDNNNTIALRPRPALTPDDSDDKESTPSTPTKRSATSKAPAPSGDDADGDAVDAMEED